MNSETSVQVALDAIQPMDLVGEKDANLRRVEERFQVATVLRNGALTLKGAPQDVERAAEVLGCLLERIKQGHVITLTDVDYFSSLVTEEGVEAARDASGPVESLEFERRTVKLKSQTQKDYVKAIREHDIVFGVGPAGTGKTYLAVAMGVQALRSRLVERMVLVRPAVEAGENLGFLPGTFEDKIDPYLRPLYDGLRDLLPGDKVQRYLELGVLEIAPLAYMRGRTLSRAFVVLDEAQNTTLKQMKMFLTRLGPHSKAVVTGDVTQVDLMDPAKSGLVRIQKILNNVTGLKFVHFQARDVVRHRLVQDIIRAFDAHPDLETDNSKGGDS